MKELRCMVFTEGELISAIADRRRRVGEPLPMGTVRTVTFSDQPPIVTTLHIYDDYGIAYPVELEEAEVAASLVKFCMDRRIPMPAKSEKFIQVINGGITLMMTMNFDRKQRLITPVPRAKPPASGGPSRRR